LCARCRGHLLSEAGTVLVATHNDCLNFPLALSVVSRILQRKKET
jgi:hypothetical protein